MKLYVAEKPSLGRAIAAVLPAPQQRKEGYIRAANGDCVSWCVGHLLEQAEPEAYDERYKRWRLEDLPIVPEQWQLRPRSGTRKQLAVLRKLMHEADSIVHCGDPDREGQLLVDELFEYLRVPKRKRDAVQRCLIADLNPAAVSRSLQKLQSNRDFQPLSVSALARSRADWLYGINMTRALTQMGKRAGARGLFSVGRVQTPVLGLVVARDRAIENFEPRPYYQVRALLQTENGEQFFADWQPSEACKDYMDEEGRVLSQALADHVVGKIQGSEAVVRKVTRKDKSQAPPLCYNLSALQIDAAKFYGISAKQCLDSCQSLYERHRLITYPRSDCRYLPEEHFDHAAATVDAIANNQKTLRTLIDDQQFHLGRRGKVWNDRKVGAHHAIAPTEKSLRTATLSDIEDKLYRLIAKRYLLQFFPDFETTETRVDIDIAGGHFLAKATQVRAPGWKRYDRLEKKGDANDGDSGSNHDGEKSANSESYIDLPPLKAKQPLLCLRGERLDKMTSPPKPFTEASLLSAMTGIARFVADPALKKILRDSDGLGTEATRAGIIDLLFQRSYLAFEGKARGKQKPIHATAAGLALIDALPREASAADMTANWESALNAISRGERDYASFMDGFPDRLTALVAETERGDHSGLSQVQLPHGKRKGGWKGKRGGSSKTAAGGKSFSKGRKRSPTRAKSRRAA